MLFISFQASLKPLCNALKNKDEAAFHHWTKSEEWATVQQIIAAHCTCIIQHLCSYSVLNLVSNLKLILPSLVALYCP